MKTSVRKIGPEEAREMLSRNTDRNRAVRQKHVALLAGAMSRGEWIVTHQGIAFDINGRLIDGQHRLLAIILSGVTIEILVTEGVDPKTFGAIDQNAHRNTADILRIDRRIADALNLAAYFAFGSSPSPSQVETVAETRIFNVLCDLHAEASATRRIWSSAPVRLAAVIRSLPGAAERDFAFGQYKALLYMDVDLMSPCSRSLLKQSNGRVSSTMKRDLLTRALVAFDMRKKDIRLIKVNEGDSADAVDHVRAVVLSEIGARRIP